MAGSIIAELILQPILEVIFHFLFYHLGRILVALATLGRCRCDRPGGTEHGAKGRNRIFQRRGRVIHLTSETTTGIGLLSCALLVGGGFWLNRALLARPDRIAVGMSERKAMTIILTQTGRDVTASLEMAGQTGSRSSTGLWWSFSNYDAVVRLFPDGGTITGMTFWSKADFEVSKVHRAKTEQWIKALKLDPKKRSVSVER